MIKRLLISFFSFLLVCSNAFATHIIGGDITVRRLAANSYEVTLTFYKDCGASSYGFDSPSLPPEPYTGVYEMKPPYTQQQIIPMGTKENKPRSITNYFKNQKK